MNKQGIVIFSSAILFLILTNLANAYLIRNVTQERQEEWERYEAYMADYIKFNDLEGYEDYISERNLMRNFGFYPPSHYYVPPQILAAKYNPPLQGDAYCTDTRGCTSSLYQPSAVKYYGEKINGRYTGYIPSTYGSLYFDHPDANGAHGYVTVQPGYRGFNYGSNYYSNSYNSNNYNSNYYPNYNDNYYDHYYDYYTNDINDIYTNEPRSYARVADPLSNGFYVVGFY